MLAPLSDEPNYRGVDFPNVFVCFVMHSPYAAAATHKQVGTAPRLQQNTNTTNSSNNNHNRANREQEQQQDREQEQEQKTIATATATGCEP